MKTTPLPDRGKFSWPKVGETRLMGNASSMQQAGGERELRGKLQWGVEKTWYGSISGEKALTWLRSSRKYFDANLYMSGKCTNTARHHQKISRYTDLYRTRPALRRMCAGARAEGKNGGKDGSISGRGWQRGQFPKRMLVDHMSLDWKSIEGTTALHCIDQRRINRQ